MKKKSSSQSAFFNPHVLLALSLCLVGAVLATLSLAATPTLEMTRANTALPSPANFPGKVSSNANRLPVGVPLPPSAEFSFNRQGIASPASTQEWFWQNPLPQGNTLFGVSFVDASTGTAVGRV
jgi:hypothetical protein